MVSPPQIVQSINLFRNRLFSTFIHIHMMDPKNKIGGWVMNRSTNRLQGATGVLLQTINGPQEAHGSNNFKRSNMLGRIRSTSRDCQVFQLHAEVLRTRPTCVRGDISTHSSSWWGSSWLTKWVRRRTNTRGEN